MTVYLNGQFIPNDAARVSVLDRGFIFGDGIYEVWRVVNGRVFEFERHHARIENGLRALRLGDPAELKAGPLQAMAERLLRENSLLEGEGTIYLQVTRGAAPRTHA